MRLIFSIRPSRIVRRDHSLSASFFVNMVTYRENNNIGIVEFNDPDSKVNVLSRSNLDTLRAIIDKITGEEAIKALFFVSGKQGIFLAGADIKELAMIRTKEDALELCKKGQELFNKIEILPMLTFVIADGACVGGGMELALACDYIIATRNKKVRFGLPEIKLGIVPGFGGPHRLERKIGATVAGHLIDTGRVIDAKEAMSSGLVDRIISKSKRFSYQTILRACNSKRNLKNMPDRDKEERRVLAEKILQDDARNALSSYLLVSRYKEKSYFDATQRIKRPVVVGAGTMGRDIAYLINSKTGLPVSLKDKDRAVLKAAKAYVRGVYKEAVERGIFSRGDAALRFKSMSFGRTSLNKADILIESITEDVLIKKELFADIEKRLHRDAVLASNTSCICLEELSKSLKEADRFLGVHFFNPAYKMRLVEVIPTRFTSKGVMERVVDFLRRLDRIVIVVKDSPGFLVNRMLLAYLNEAVFMLQDGFAPEDIDSVMLEFGMPVGPMRLIEDIGPSVAYKAGKILEDNFGSRLRAPDALKDGFVSIGPSCKKASSNDMVGRLLRPMKREAGLCLKEGVADNREIIDIALMLGAGFPRKKRIWKI